MEFKIAVPSYRRSDIFKHNTLKFLNSVGVPPQCVDVFLSDAEDYKDYKALGVKCINPKMPIKSLREKFARIEKHYKVGTRVLLMEDDVEDIIYSPKAGSNDKSSVGDLFLGFMQQGFTCMEKVGGKIFGIQPHANPFFMKETVTHDLRFLVAQVYGFISTHNPKLTITQDAKGDYERTLLYFVEYGFTTRLNALGPVSDNYTAEGGLQTEFTFTQRLEREKAACEYLTKRFPHFVRYNEKKESRFPELLLKNVRSNERDFYDWKAYQAVWDAAR